MDIQRYGGPSGTVAILETESIFAWLRPEVGAATVGGTSDPPGKKAGVAGSIYFVNEQPSIPLAAMVRTTAAR
jgi:hypothetical protein